MYPRRVEHYPRLRNLGERVVVHCACGDEFRGDDLQEAANAWGEHAAKESVS